MYLWGNVSGYVVSYYHMLGDEKATMTLAVACLPLSFFVQTCFNPLGAFWQKKYNPKLVILLGVSIMSGSILFASYMKTWWSFVAFYCFGYPAGIGIVYWVPIMCGWEWFPENKGLVSGLVVGGYGFGAFIFGFVTTAIANPENLKASVPSDGSTTDKIFPDSVAEQVPYMYRFCFWIWTALGLLAVFGVSRNPEFVRQEKVRLRMEKIQKIS